MEKLFNFIKLIFPSGMALLILGILIILMPVYLLIISNTVMPLSLWLKQVFLDEVVPSGTFAVNQLIPNLVIIALLSISIFILYSSLSAIHSFNMFRITTRDFSSAGESLKNVVMKALKWKLYRLRYIAFPPVLVILAGLIWLLFTMYAFNLILMFAGISVGLVTLITTFIVLCLALAFAFSIFNSFWRITSTLLGTESLIADFGISNKMIKERSERLIFVKRPNLNLAIIYWFFNITIVMQALSVILMPEILSENNFFPIMIAIIFDISLFAVLGFLRVGTYLDSLSYQYRKVTAIGNNYPDHGNLSF